MRGQLLPELTQAVVAARVDPAMPVLEKERVAAIVQHFGDEITGEIGRQGRQSTGVGAYEVQVGDRGSAVAESDVGFGAQEDEFFVPDDRDRRDVGGIHDRPNVRADTLRGEIDGANHGLGGCPQITRSIRAQACIGEELRDRDNGPRGRVEQRIHRVARCGAVHVIHTGGETGGGTGRGADERFVQGREGVGPATAVHFEAGLETTVDAQEVGWCVEPGEAGRKRERECRAGRGQIGTRFVEERRRLRVRFVAGDERALHGGILRHLEHETEGVTHAQLVHVLERHERFHEALHTALLRRGVIGHGVHDIENRVGRTQIAVRVRPAGVGTEATRLQRPDEQGEHVARLGAVEVHDLAAEDAEGAGPGAGAGARAGQDAGHGGVYRCGVG